MARSSLSLLPASEIGAAPWNERTDASSDGTAGAAAAGTSGEVAATGVAGAGRARVGGLEELRVGCGFCAAAWDEVSRAKSSRMLRVASHPGSSSNPRAAACFTRFVILIPSTRTCWDSVNGPCGPIAALPHGGLNDAHHGWLPSRDPADNTSQAGWATARRCEAGVRACCNRRGFSQVQRSVDHRMATTITQPRSGNSSVFQAEAAESHGGLAGR